MEFTPLPVSYFRTPQANPNGIIRLGEGGWGGGGVKATPDLRENHRYNVVFIVLVA